MQQTNCSAHRQADQRGDEHGGEADLQRQRDDLAKVRIPVEDKRNGCRQCDRQVLHERVRIGVIFAALPEVWQKTVVYPGGSKSLEQARKRLHGYPAAGRHVAAFFGQYDKAVGRTHRAENTGALAAGEAHFWYTVDTGRQYAALEFAPTAFFAYVTQRACA